MKFRSGVLHGEEVTELLNYANENDFALPAVNVVNTSSVNAVLQTAKEVNSPVIIQFSNGGGTFYAGKHLDNEFQKAAIAGSISGAYHVHLMAKEYDVPVILHTDHCAKSYYLGLMGFWKKEKSFLRRKESLYSALIC